MAVPLQQELFSHPEEPGQLQGPFHFVLPLRLQVGPQGEEQLAGIAVLGRAQLPQDRKEGCDGFRVDAAEGVDADVIMVTSANDAKTVNDAARLGAVDYLVKPFAYERFRQALDVFCRRRESVQRDSFSQEALDHTLFQAAVPTQPVTPPKGLQSQTLSRIEAYLRAAPDTRHTSDEIASHVGLSVVTVRRYMNYLTEQQVIGSEMDYRTGGRPCLVYFLRK